MIDDDKIRKQNLFIKQWTPKVQRKIKSKVGSMIQTRTSRSSVKKRVDVESMVMRKSADAPRLKDSIKTKTFKHDKVEIDGISITFARQGVFVIKGAGPGNRTPKDFLSPVLDAEFPKLAAQVAETKADIVLSEMSKTITNGNKNRT